MLRTFEVHDLTEDQAREVVQTQLKPVMDKLTRHAHRQGARRGREAYAEHSFEGPLFDAAVRLRDEFEDAVRKCFSEAWIVSFGYSVRNNAPHIVMLRLK